MDKACRHAGRLFEHIHAQAPLLHLGNQRRQLQFGHARANAAVDAIAKGQVAPGIFPIDDDLVTIREDAFVAIGRDIPERQLVPLLI